MCVASPSVAGSWKVAEFVHQRDQQEKCGGCRSDVVRLGAAPVIPEEFAKGIGIAFVGLVHGGVFGLNDNDFGASGLREFSSNQSLKPQTSSRISETMLGCVTVSPSGVLIDWNFKAFSIALSISSMVKPFNADMNPKQKTVRVFDTDGDYQREKKNGQEFF